MQTVILGTKENINISKFVPQSVILDIPTAIQPLMGTLIRPKRISIAFDQ